MNKFKYNTFARLLTGYFVNIICTDGERCFVSCAKQNRQFWIHENNLKEF